MERLGEAVLLLVLLTDLALLVTGRLSASIRLVALQGVLLGLVPLTLAHAFSIHLAAIVVGTIAIKAVVLPRILLWAIREAEVRREREPLDRATCPRCCSGWRSPAWPSACAGAAAGAAGPRAVAAGAGGAVHADDRLPAAHHPAQGADAGGRAT